MIESLEKLRKGLDAWTRAKGEYETVSITRSGLLKHLDDIEREVEERYIELPKDMNGVPIHVGDKVRTSLGSTYVVSRITREDFKGTTTWYIEDFASHYSLGPEDLTLCKPPTVEDVLREFGRGWHEQMNGPEMFDIADYVERYAAKLQLKEAE